MAARSAAAPSGAFVLRRREDGAKASLTPVKQSEMLKRVVLRNFAHDVRSAELVERLHGLVGAAGCYRLRYSHLGNAVDLLKRAFDDWPAPQAAHPVTSTTGPATGRRGRLTRTAGSAACAGSRRGDRVRRIAVPTARAAPGRPTSSASSP